METKVERKGNNLLQVEDWLPLASKLAKKHTWRVGSEGIGTFDDVYHIAVLAVIEATGKFSPDRGVKPITFLWKVIEGRISNYRAKAFRDMKKEEGIIKVSLDIETTNGNGYGSIGDLIGKEDDYEVEIINAIGILNDREKFCLNLLMQGYDRKEIAKQLGMSYCTVTRATESARKKLEKEGII